MTLASVAFVARKNTSLSEMGPFQSGRVQEEPMWGASLGSRHYIGQGQGVNDAYGYLRGQGFHFGRMSLPRPSRHSTESATMLTVTPAATYGSGPAVAGDIDPAETRYRVYRICYANEEGVDLLSAAQGDSAVIAADARNAANDFPGGMYGPLSMQQVVASFTTGNTVATISVINWAPPAEYKITHAYVWAGEILLTDADTDLTNQQLAELYGATTTGQGVPEGRVRTEDNVRSSEPLVIGPFSYVGKIPYDESTGFTSQVLHDTLSSTQLEERAKHPNRYVSVPSFTSATATRNSLVGACSGDQIFATNDSANTVTPYVKVTNGSKTIQLVNSTGGALTGYRWPRWIENSGGTLFLDRTDSKSGYEIDYIDKNDPTLAYLWLPFQSASTQSATGDDFSIKGSNDLYICVPNRQLQESCEVGFIVDGYTSFGGPITAVASHPESDEIYIATLSGIWLLSGLPPTQVAVDSATPPTYSIRPVTLTQGVAGPRAMCAGPDGVVFALSSDAVLMIRGFQVETGVLSTEMRDWLRNLTKEDKHFCEMAYHRTLQWMVALFPHIPNVDRSTALTGLVGNELREIALCWDMANNTATVMNGGRWRHLCVGQSARASLGGEGAGEPLLLQDLSGAVSLMNSRRLTDREPDPVYGMTQEGTIAAIEAGLVTVTPDDPTRGVNVYARAVYLVALSGTNRGSRAQINGVLGSSNQVLVGDWSDGTPAVGDKVVIGGIQARYVTGAYRFGTARGYLNCTKMEADVANASSEIVTSAYSGGVTDKLPPYQSPTVEATSTKAVIDAGRLKGIPRQNLSSRIAVGVDWVQPSDTEENGAGDRIRLRTLTAYFNEEAQKGR